MTLQEHIRRILKEELNESTYLRRMVDISLMDKEFYENLNYVTSIFLEMKNEGETTTFPKFKKRVIDWSMDNYHSELTNYDKNDYPYDEVYEFFSKHFHDKIKDRYDSVFGTNIQKSIKRTLREENSLLPMIRRRIPHDDLEKEFIEALDKASFMLVSLNQNGGGITNYDRFEHITISMTMDGIHYELHSTLPKNLDWYDDVFNNLKDHYRHRINVRYNNLLLDL
jgi:hypothetical protein